MPDSDGERAIRWLLVLALIAVAVARVADMQVPGLD
jgi:hypothetical protein